MDLSLIKKKLQESTEKKQGSSFQKIDFSKILWKPKVGKHQIRIVPSVLDKNYPFTSIDYYYGLTKAPILALTNWGEKDPILEFSIKLGKSSDPEDWKLSNFFKPKTRYFVPVIVRGEEDQGVRLWEFGKKIWLQLLSIADDPDYGDYTNIYEGRDFSVEGVEKENFGRKIVECTVIPKPKTSPLSNNKNQVELWLKEQPNILEINKKHTFDELKQILQNFLSKDSDNSEESSKEEEDDFLSEINKPVITTMNSSNNNFKSNSDKFDELFED